jgi:hypothetical protein
MNRALASLNTAVEEAQVAKVREEVVGLVTDARETNRQVGKLVEQAAADLEAAELAEATARLNRTMRRLEQLVESEVESILASLVKASGHLEKLADAARKYPAHMILGGAPPRSEAER